MIDKLDKREGALLPHVSLSRPVTVTMCLVALMVVGVLALKRIPIQDFPFGLEARTISVWVPVQRNTPTIEKDQYIAQPMIEYLKAVKGLRRLWTSSETWGVHTRLEFRNDMDMALAYGKVTEAVELMRPLLPEEVRQDIRIWKYDKDADEEILWIGISMPDHVENYHDYIHTTVQRPLERIDGACCCRIGSRSRYRAEGRS